jgi:hypothetical protein
VRVQDDVDTDVATFLHQMDVHASETRDRILSAAQQFGKHHSRLGQKLADALLQTQPPKKYCCCGVSLIRLVHSLNSCYCFLAICASTAANAP